MYLCFNYLKCRFSLYNLRSVGRSVDRSMPKWLSKIGSVNLAQSHVEGCKEVQELVLCHKI